ncbi:unnamed protein product [Dicrocoelium dendriticum]|nr:unnamed protein product [Dicrocoelium dendriticum]
MSDSLSCLPLDVSKKNEDDEEKVKASALYSSELSVVTEQQLQELTDATQMYKPFSVTSIKAGLATRSSVVNYESFIFYDRS